MHGPVPSNPRSTGRQRKGRQRRSSAIQSACYVVELLEDRRLLSGSISGVLWEDVNRDSTLGSSESRLAGRAVFLDQNRNGRHDVSEWSTVTNNIGAYAFTGLSAGAYFVARETINSDPIALTATSSNATTIPLTTSASNAPIHVDGEEVDAPITPSDAQSNP